MPLTELSNAAWWMWLIAVITVVSIGVARGLARDETIRRQLASEITLKARFDDLFDRSSEIMIVHDRRGRLSTINRSGEQTTGYLGDELRMLGATNVLMKPFTADTLAARITELVTGRTEVDGRS